MARLMNTSIWKSFELKLDDRLYDLLFYFRAYVPIDVLNDDLNESIISSIFDKMAVEDFFQPCNLTFTEH